VSKSIFENTHKISQNNLQTIYTQASSTEDISIPKVKPPSFWDVTRGTVWNLFAHISVQPIGSILNQAAQEGCMEQVHNGFIRR
jgi:hypothetical protein